MNRILFSTLTVLFNKKLIIFLYRFTNHISLLSASTIIKAGSYNYLSILYKLPNYITIPHYRQWCYRLVNWNYENQIYLINCSIFGLF